ncbi:MAG TPA: peptidylprolyl isomerase, partial [Kofleriaceae bacterium]|nr:peptidylprolyl isomerase [Kofleriaceae bacterium]
AVMTLPNNIRITRRPLLAPGLAMLAALFAHAAAAAAQPTPPAAGSAAPGPATPAPTPATPTTQAKPVSRNAGKRIMLERVVAVVNNAIIMRSELDVRMLPVMAEAENIADPKERSRRIDKLTSQVLEEMINEQLIVEAAEAQHIEVEADDINATLDDIKKQNSLDDAGLAQALSQQGYTVAGYRADLRKQLLRLRAINQMVRPKVNVSDEDVRARYDQMNRRTEGTSAVRLSHMLFRLPDHPTEQQIADAKNRASAALSRVRAGEVFDKVAGEVSEDDATKTTGGELGWFSRGSLSVPEWETVVFAMEKGDVRGPITGPQGFHLFLVSEIKRAETKPFNDMKEQVRNELTRRAMEKQTQVWLDDLRKKAFVEIKLDANAAP